MPQTKAETMQGHMKSQGLNLDSSPTFVDEIKTGVNNTFSSMFGFDPIPRQHRIETNVTATADVSGIISIIQDKAEGAFIVSFPKATIFKILSKMYRRDFNEINMSVTMGVGELTNIIYGVAKTNLNKKGYKLKMAIPNVIVGEGHTVHACAMGPTLVIPFDSPAGPFQTLMVFHNEGLIRDKTA